MAGTFSQSIPTIDPPLCPPLVAGAEGLRPTIFAISRNFAQFPHDFPQLDRTLPDGNPPPPCGVGGTKKVNLLIGTVQTPCGNAPYPCKPLLQVSVRLYQCDGPHSTFATPFTQVVSTQIPTQDGRRPCYVHSDSVGEYWPCMLEKAVAAAHYRTRSGENGYDAQAGGICGIGMGQLLGGFPGVAYGANLSAADLFTAWDYLMAQGITVTCAWNPVLSSSPSPLPSVSLR